MKLVICYSPSKSNDPGNYDLWYLKLGLNKRPYFLGIISKQKLVEDLFKDYQQTGESQWQVMPKNSSKIKKVDIFDLIAKNPLENSHFGDLPHVKDFHLALKEIYRMLSTEEQQLMAS